MKLEHQQAQAQILAPMMQQALLYLQLAPDELTAQLERAAADNPLIHLDYSKVASEHIITHYHSAAADNSEHDIEQFVSNELAYPESYTDHLNSQLGQMRLLDEKLLSVCRYIVSCLSASGYLNISTAELAHDLGISEFEVEQALYVVQDLDPPGTGARSLTECLLLQLAAGDGFTELNIHMVKSGLELLAKKDYRSLARKYGEKLDAIMSAADIIRGLNPIPSSGFFTGEKDIFIAPEAELVNENGSIGIQKINAYIPEISIDSYYLSLMGSGEYPEAQEYLEKNFKAAGETIALVQRRESTVFKLIELIARKQNGFFSAGLPLSALSLSEAADELGLNVSTVSRAVKGKYILFEKRIYPLRSFFVGAASSSSGELSSDAVRTHIRKLIAGEDKAKPLSDSALCGALQKMGISVSRRTVAKYREQDKIPAAFGRKASPD